MRYGHVGRPTKKEVRNKKVKKVLIVSLPILFICMILIFSNSKILRNIMGNTAFDYNKCEPCDHENGWKEGEDNTCYLEQIENSSIDALLIRGVLDTVDEDVEINSTNSLIATGSTDLDDENYIYKCPDDEESISLDALGRKLYITKKYTLKDKTCNVETKTIISKPAICNDNKHNEVEDKKTSDSPSLQDVKVSSCTNDNCSDESEIYPVEGNLDVMDEVEVDSDVNQIEDEDDDVAHINRTTNHYLYGDQNSGNNVEIYTKNSESGLSISSEKVKYTLFTSKNACDNNSDGIVISKEKETSSAVYKISKYDSKLNVSDINYKFDYSKLMNNNLNQKYYIKQSYISDEYVIDNECKEINPNSKLEFTNEPSNKNKSYSLNIDHSNIYKDYKNETKKLYTGENIRLENGISKEGYSFVGWSIYNKNKKYLCYKSGKNKTMEWSSTCSNGKVIIKDKGNISDIISKNINSNDSITIQSEWKKDKKITVKIKNSKDNSSYNRYAVLMLYNDKTSCKKALKIKNGNYPNYKQNSIGWINKKKISKTGKKEEMGIFTFTRKMIVNKKYYGLLITSKYYNQLKNNCFELDTNDSDATVKVEPKKFSVTFDGNGGTVKMNKITKYTDVDVNIPKPIVSRKGYHFSYWTISRKKENNEKEYRCYDNNNNRGWYEKKQCAKKIRYDKNSIGFILKVNSYNNSGLVLTANWSPVKEKQVNKFVTPTVVTNKVLGIDHKIMQDIHIDKNNNFYISQDNFEKYPSELTINKISSSGLVSPYVQNLKYCGHGLFDMNGQDIIISCSSSSQYERLTHGHIVYRINPSNISKKVKIADVYTGRETMKIDENNNQAIIRLSGTRFNLYNFNTKNSSLGSLIYKVDLNENELPTLDGQGYDISDGKLYVLSGEGIGTGTHQTNYSVGYIYVFNIYTSELLQKNTVFYRTDMYKEPEGITVKGDYVYFGVASTDSASGIGGTKYATIYKIKKNYLY